MIIITDTYSQPDAPDPVLSGDRVLELARRHTGSAGTVTAIDESGGEARTYMCGDDLVFKTQRPHRLRPRTSLAKEALILRQLAALPGIPVPRVLGYGREPDAEYILMTRIPGVPLKSTSLAGPARTAVLEQAGATLRQIHNAGQAAMENSGLIPGDESPAGLHDRLSAMFERLTAELDSDPRWATHINLHAVARQCLDCLPTGTPPVTLHSNPGPEHCYIDPATGHFTGLIDFGDAYRSHPALDVRSWRSADDSRHMLAGYQALGPLPDGFDQVWRTGLILATLRLATRGHRQPEETAHTISDLLNS